MSIVVNKIWVRSLLSLNLTIRTMETNSYEMRMNQPAKPMMARCENREMPTSPILLLSLKS